MVRTLVLYGKERWLLAISVALFAIAILLLPAGSARGVDDTDSLGAADGTRRAGLVVLFAERSLRTRARYRRQRRAQQEGE